MRGEGFWKRIVILCLTFWIGTIVSDSFISKKSSPNEAVITEKRNCLPADPKLKYLFLKEGLSEKEMPSVEEKKKLMEQMTTEVEENQKHSEKKDKLLYRPSKDYLEYQTLLHKENCFESNGRK